MLGLMGREGYEDIKNEFMVSFNSSVSSALFQIRIISMDRQYILDLQRNLNFSYTSKKIMSIARFVIGRSQANENLTSMLRANTQEPHSSSAKVFFAPMLGVLVLSAKNRTSMPIFGLRMRGNASSAELSILARLKI
jgi:hypothetical protein